MIESGLCPIVSIEKGSFVSVLSKDGRQGRVALVD